MAVDRKVFGGVGTKILLWFLVISITPAACITFIGYRHSKKLIEEQLARHLESTAEAMSKGIRNYLDAKKGRLIGFASDGFIRDGLVVINSKGSGNERVVERLNHHLSVNQLPLDPDILAVSVINLDGKCVASSDEAWLGRDISEKGYFIQGIRLGIYMTDLHYCEDLQEYETMMTMSRLLTNNRTAIPIGVLVITLRGDALSDITRTWSIAGDEASTSLHGLGRTGEVYVVNEDNLMITESRFVENAVLELAVDAEPVKSAYFGEETSGIYLNYRGVKVLGASRLIDETGWVVLAEKDLSEVVEPIMVLRNIGIVLSGASAVVVIIVALLITHSLTKPIHKLVSATRRVAEGDLNHHIITTKKDEIGHLSVSFNEMTNSLKEAQVRQQEDFRTLRETQFITMVRLAMLAEKRDPETGEHLERMKGYPRLLAAGLRRLEKYKEIIDYEFIEMLVQSSPLHDIGKVAIPDSILLKKGRLTMEEFEVMKGHAEKGAEILKGPEFLKMGYEIALSHHEKYDGSGYPNGLSGEDIPLSARIVALADVYDAVTTKRVYKEAESHEVACSIIISESGKSFDPEIVRVFEENADKFVKVKERFQST